MTTSRERALRLVEELGMARAHELEARGVSRALLARLVRAGELRRVSRGVYVAADHAPTEAHSLAIVAKRVPRAVFCLLTALRFHDLTTQPAPEVWIALPEKARRPRLDYPHLEIVRFSPAGLTEGAEVHVVEGVRLRITSPARTVVDCFRYRNRIGIDVAIEALREFGRRYRGSADELARLARAFRAARVMQPYLDAIP